MTLGEPRPEDETDLTAEELPRHRRRAQGTRGETDGETPHPPGECSPGAPRDAPRADKGWMRRTILTVDSPVTPVETLALASWHMDGGRFASTVSAHGRITP